MATYKIFFEAGASACVTVEAESLDEAIDLAYDETPSICAQCGGWGRDYSLDLGEWEVDDKAYERDGEWIEEKS